LIKGKPFFLRDKVSVPCVYDGFSVKENCKTRFNSGRALTLTTARMRGPLRKGSRLLAETQQEKEKERQNNIGTTSKIE
jgi:hypothetical protein